MITGTVPVDALTRLINGKNGDPLQPVNEVLPSLPATVAHVIGRAMSLDSDERFASVEEFWQALQQAVQRTRTGSATLPITPPPLPSDEWNAIRRSARQTNSGKYTSRFLQKNLLLLLRAVVLVLLVTGGALMYSFLSHHPSTGHHAAPVPPSSTSVIVQPHSAYPSLAASYAGTIFDIDVAKEKTAMYLTDVHQHQGTFTGTFQGLGQIGSCSGTVTKTGEMRFAVKLPAQGETLSFRGTIKVGGDIVGDFDVLNFYEQQTGENGIWNVGASS